MRILIATDAWHPQVNGVVRTLEFLKREAALLGHDIAFVTPQDFSSFPLPGYPEIRLAFSALWSRKKIIQKINSFAPEAIHIATEGPIGLATRSVCLKTRRSFTTSYHTRFPEYLSARLPVPLSISYSYMRWFHQKATATMVATPTLERDLQGRGFKNLLRWERGVDAVLFKPRSSSLFNFPRPYFLSVGRVAVEKNLEAFLSLELKGSKIVVGDGPALQTLKEKYPDVHFLGKLAGEELADIFSSADVFVFPSRTDTFGLVILEALASGVPVAAFPVMGPQDIILQGITGFMSEDLSEACIKALSIPRENCRAYAEQKTWAHVAAQFIENIRKAKGC